MGKIIKKNYDIESKINKKIVLLSDIHYYNKKDIKKLNKILKKIQSINPDYICISGDLIDEAKSMNEEISLESSKANDDRKSLNKLWDLILMTNKQIEYTKYFDENVDSLLALDLDDEKQFNEVYKELKPVISALNKYSKMGMTFSINPETDDLIEKVLILKGNKKLVNKLNQLKEKEYFVE